MRGIADDGAGERRRMPERVGRYEVLLPIASGGMATVYLARSRGAGGFERDFALKLTHAHLLENHEFRESLVEEAKLAVQIRHPNVVSVVDVGEDIHGLFLVMDYIEGDTLSGLVRRAVAAGAPLPPRIGLRVLVDALNGLHAAHELRDENNQSIGLVHRDFSPQNILAGLDGAGRLTDFGIAKAATRISDTRTGSVKGKIGYIAPEQTRSHPLDRRADIWAGGVMAWELLAARRLWPQNQDELAMLLRIATEEPPRLRDVRPDLPPELDAAVSFALERDPRRRCPTANAFAQSLITACHAAGMPIAEPAEVAAWVRDLVGARLAERRARAKEILALRRQMGALTETGHNASLVTTSDSLGGFPASQPSITLDRTHVEPRPNIPPPPAPPGLPFGAIDPHAAPDEPTTLFDPPGAAPSAAAPSADEPTKTDTTSVSPPHGARRLVELGAGAEPKRSAAPVLLAVAAASLVGLIVAVVVVRFGARSAAEPQVESATAATTSVASAAPVVSSAPPVTTGEPPKPQPAESAAPPVTMGETPKPPARRITLKANAPMASVRINGRAVPIARAATTVEIDLQPEETGPIRVEAQSADGRAARQTVPDAATAAALRFPVSEVPLANNPYGRKR